MAARGFSRCRHGCGHTHGHGHDQMSDHQGGYTTTRRGRRAMTRGKANLGTFPRMPTKEDMTKPDKVYCESRYYVEKEGVSTYLDTLYTFSFEYTPDQILRCDCGPMIDELVGAFGALLANAGIEAEPGSTINVSMRQGLGADHVILNFWMSKRTPKCTLVYKEVEELGEGKIHSWNASLSTVAISLKIGLLPIWLKAFREKEETFPPNTFLILQLNYPDRSQAPVLEGWFETSLGGCSSSSQTSKRSETMEGGAAASSLHRERSVAMEHEFCHDHFDVPNKSYMIEVRFPYHLLRRSETDPISEPSDQHVGYAFIKKVNWVNQKLKRITYRF